MALLVTDGKIMQSIENAGLLQLPYGESHNYKKEGGVRWEFWKEPLKGTKIPSCGHDMEFVSPLRGTKLRVLIKQN